MYNQVVFWIFRWVNILLILGAFAYFFHVKLIHLIREQIAAKRTFFQSLYEKLEQTIRKNAKINKNIEAQQKESMQLLHKAEQWATTVATVQQEDEAAHTQRLKQLAVYRKQQLENHAMQQARHSIIPQAIKSADGALHKEFAKPEAQRQYMHDIITFMKKN